MEVLYHEHDRQYFGNVPFAVSLTSSLQMVATCSYPPPGCVQQYVPPQKNKFNLFPPVSVYLGSVPYSREADVVPALNVVEASVVQDARCEGDGVGVSENEGYPKIAR